ncbi:MAG: hypothetical protein JWL60_87, partial [Gemmatimonadetes bacterium]|nr:hypothetical protein [Gemmatimonadota bacterium]
MRVVHLAALVLCAAAARPVHAQTVPGSSRADSAAPRIEGLTAILLGEVALAA